MLISQGLKGLFTLCISVVIAVLSIQGNANANPEIVSVIADAPPARPYYPREITEFNGQAYFSARSKTGSYYEYWLWTSNGFDAWKIKGFSRAAPAALTVFDNNLYFFADDGIHGGELWKSDGTESGTILVKDITPGSYGSYYFSSNHPGSIIVIRASLLIHQNPV